MKFNKEWTEEIFSDVVEINPKETLKKGITAKKIAMADLKEHTKEIQNFVLKEYTSGTKFKKGDTLFARISPSLENGKIAKADLLDGGEVGFGSTEFIVMRAKPEVTNDEYVYYLSLWNAVKGPAIKSMTGTTGRQRVQEKIFDQLSIKLPPMDEQIIIGDILATIDNKISINNKIITNLESQGQAIFKSWFVDFEPFENDEFIESELGLIPRKFTILPLKELVNVDSGFAFKSKLYVDGGMYKVITIKNILDGHLDSIGSNTINASADELKKYPELKIGDILFTMTGNVGRVALVHEKGLLQNQRVGRIILSNDDQLPYFYFLMRSPTFKKIMVNLSQGTAQANLGKNDFLDITVSYNEDYANKFSRLTFPYINTIINLKRQNIILAQLRDTLLPKLMSGEIDVSKLK